MVVSYAGEVRQGQTRSLTKRRFPPDSRCADGSRAARKEGRAPEFPRWNGWRYGSSG